MKLRELGRTELRHRLQSTFLDGYLTIISIVQGAVFTFGAQKTLDLLSANPDDLTFLIWAAASFLYVVTVYYYYYWFLICFGAFPTYGEIVRPFLLGAIEFAAVYNIADTRRFLLVSSIFFLLASGIFLYAWKLNRRSLYKDDAQKIYDLLHAESIKNMLGTLLLSAVCGVSYAMIVLDNSSFEYFNLTVFIVMFIVSSTLVWLSETRFRDKLFAIARED